MPPLLIQGLEAWLDCCPWGAAHSSSIETNGAGGLCLCGFAGPSCRGIPTQRLARTTSHIPPRQAKKIAHGANRWAIKEPALDPGRTAHFQALHVQNHQVVDHRRAFLPYHMDVALQHHLGTARQYLDRLDPGA